MYLRSRSWWQCRHRFGGDRHKAEDHFEQGFRRSFAILRQKMDLRFSLMVSSVFEQDDYIAIACRPEWLPE